MQSAVLAWEPEWRESSTFNTVVGRSTCQFKFSGTEQLHAKPHDKTKLKQTSSTSYCQGSSLPHFYLLRRQLFHSEQLYLFGAWTVEFCSSKGVLCSVDTLIRFAFRNSDLQCTKDHGIDGLWWYGQIQLASESPKASFANPERLHCQGQQLCAWAATGGI